MKKLTIKVSVVLALLCVSLISAKIYHKQDGKRKEMHKEMREYVEQNIIPILKEQRLKLDKKLSSEEKETIATMREVLHAAHKERRAEKKKFHEQMKNGELSKEVMHEHFKKKRAEHKEQLAPIKAIADNHEKQIEKLLEVAKANKETWKQEMETIRRKYISDEELEKMRANKKHHHRPHKEGDKKHADNGQKHGKHKGGKKMHRGGHHLKMLHRTFSPVGFLLWDAKAPMPSFDDEITQESLDVYPNPSTVANKISFETAQKGQVKVELLDKKGNLLKTVLNETKSKGQHTLNVSLEGLANAVYYYRITTPSGSKTTRFIINH